MKLERMKLRYLVVNTQNKMEIYAAFQHPDARNRFLNAGMGPGQPYREDFKAAWVQDNGEVRIEVWQD